VWWIGNRFGGAPFQQCSRIHCNNPERAAGRDTGIPACAAGRSSRSQWPGRPRRNGILVESGHHRRHRHDDGRGYGQGNRLHAGRSEFRRTVRCCAGSGSRGSGRICRIGSGGGQRCRWRNCHAAGCDIRRRWSGTHRSVCGVGDERITSRDGG
jgi:hypothetical protein